MHPLATPSATSTKRHRQSVKPHRRFLAKDTRKKEIIPMTTTATRKVKNGGSRGLRLLGFVAFFFMSLSTVSVWHKRAVLRRQPPDVLSVSTRLSNPSFTGNHSLLDDEMHQQGASEGTQPSNITAQNTSQSTTASENSTDFEPPVFKVPKSSSGLAGRPLTMAEETEKQFNSAVTSQENNVATQNDGNDDDDRGPGTEKKDDDSTPPKATKQQDTQPTSSEVSKDKPISSSSSSQSSTSESTTAVDHGHIPAQVEPPAAPLPPYNASLDVPVTYGEFPERIEWYSRDDFKEGTRPLCRISHPYILSNGTILFPAWMERYDRLLDRCAIGKHGFYSASETPTFMQKANLLDIDFALTIHLSRFQEPTHDASVYLTEHVLKASYLFDIFGGDAKETEAIHEEHCFTYANESKCELKRPPRMGLKPGLFVPRRIEIGSRETWAYKIVEMFGRAHGHGKGVQHLNASSLLVSKHAGKAEGLIGTRFRSIMTMDGMFRHLPVDAVRFGNFYSLKNGIDMTPKKFLHNGKCSLTIGITSAGSGETFKGGSELRTKLDVLTKFAFPDATITVVEVNTRTASMNQIVRKVQTVDIFVGPSGPDLNNIGFMHPSSSVLELMPYGIRPNTHESLARSIGLGYESSRGKPQTEFFKKCLESEVFMLRKKGRLNFTEKPAWFEPVINAWDERVAEFTKSSSTEFDMLSADAPVRNDHSRVCAQRQEVDVGVDTVARHIVMMTKAKCGAK